jgi:hypothetical protein
MRSSPRTRHFHLSFSIYHFSSEEKGKAVKAVIDKKEPEFAKKKTNFELGSLNLVADKIERQMLKLSFLNN